MKKIIRRTVSLALAFVMVVPLFPFISIEADAQNTENSSWYTGWLWPVPTELSVKSVFGYRTHKGGDLHHGIDITTSSGTPVLAAKDGTIETVKYDVPDENHTLNTLGNYVIINHHDGTYSIYEHMRYGKTDGIEKGKTVQQGMQIGKVGNTGDSSGSHLHFQVFTSLSNRSKSALNTMPDESLGILLLNKEYPEMTKNYWEKEHPGVAFPSQRMLYILDPAEAGYLSKCEDNHATYAEVTLSRSVSECSIPCTPEVNSGSKEGSEYRSGTKLIVNRYVRNDVGEYWLQLLNGQWIPAGGTSRAQILNPFSFSSVGISNNRVDPNSYSKKYSKVSGTLSVAGGSRLAYQLESHCDDGQWHKTWTTTSSLKNNTMTEINDITVFRDLPAGTYHFYLTASTELFCPYGADDNWTWETKTVSSEPISVTVLGNKPHEYCAHTYNERGICTKCGQDYYRSDTYRNSVRAAQGRITTNYGGTILVREMPYANSAEKASFKGSILKEAYVTLLKKVTNHEGNSDWFYVSYDNKETKTCETGYVYCPRSADNKKLGDIFWLGQISTTIVSNNDLKNSGNTTSIPYASGDAVVVPATIRTGQHVHVGGTVYAPSDVITSIDVGIYNSDGSATSFVYHNSNVNSDSFDLTKANDTVAFSKLAAGQYTFKIQLTTSKGGNVLLRSEDFSVTARGSSVPVYSVTFDSNGGNLDRQYRTVTSGQTVALRDLTSPSRPGYRFLGWSSSSTSGSPEYSSIDTIKPTSSRTYYAVWQKVDPPAAPSMAMKTMDVSTEDVVTFSWWSSSNADGYELYVRNEHGDVVYSANTAQTSASTLLTTPDSYSATVIAYNAGGRSDESTPITVVAHGPSKVTFLLEDGGEVWSEQSVPYLKSAVEPAMPEKEGYKFEGWSGSYSNVMEDTTVVARFTPIIYSVNFYDYNGNLAATRAVSYNGNLPGAAEPPAPSQLNIPDGWTFLGWDTDEYLSVKRNGISVHPSCIYEIQDIPITTRIEDVERVASGSQIYGYWVSYAITNNVDDAQSGRVVVVLKSGEGKFLTKTESGAFYLDSVNCGTGKNRYEGSIYIPVGKEIKDAEAYVEIYVVNSYNTLVPISNATSRAVSDDESTWSAWMTEEEYAAYSGDKTYSDSKLEYRIRTKQVSDWTNASSLPGWTLAETRTIKSEYGAFGPWTTTPIYGSDNVQVETRDDSYSYTRYRYGRWYRDSLENNSYCSARFYSGGTTPTIYWTDYTTNRYQQVGNDWTCGNTSLGRDHDHSYAAYSENGIPYWHLYSANGSTSKSDRYFWEEADTVHVPQTSYRCRTRYDITQYRYIRWSDWGTWSTDASVASDTVEVESRRLYRVRIPVSEAVDGEEVSGVLPNAEAAANGVAILNIYKVDEASDYSNEYMAMTTIGADGSYSFRGIHTYEEPTAKTGDFTVTLTVQGSTGPVVLETGKFKAPKEQYKVTFVNGETGEVIDTQYVEEGGSAISPEIPVMDGYTFIGYSYGLTNIRDEMTIELRYYQNKYTVVFTDYLNNAVSIRSDVPYGTKLDIEDPPEIPGHRFIEWRAEDGSSIDCITHSMVVNAVYEAQTFEITFVDPSGNTLLEMECEYADSVDLEDDRLVFTVPEGMYFEKWNTNGVNLDYVTSSGTISPVLRYDEDAQHSNVSVVPGIHQGNQVIEVTPPSEDATVTITINTIADGISAVEDFEYSLPFELTDSAVVTVTTTQPNKNSVSESYEYTIVPENSVPGIPQNLTVTVDTSAIHLHWDEVSGATGYLVFRDDGCGGLSRYITSNAHFDDNAVEALKDYSYSIYSYSLFESGDASEMLLSKEAANSKTHFLGNTVVADRIEISAPDSVLDGNTVGLIATVYPENAHDQTVSWSVIDGTGSAVISLDGMFTAVTPGTVCVRAETNDGSGVFATKEILISVPSSDSVVLTAESMTAVPGHEIVVPIQISSKAQISELHFIALYDADALQLISAEAGGVVSSIGSAAIESSVSGKVVYSWSTDAATSVNGDILNLHFKVLQAEKPEALIRFESEEGSQSVCTVWTGGEQASMNCETIAGRITFLNILLGDVNGDGSVNVIDANMVRRAAAKLILLSDTQKLAADVNHDGKINIVDANLIRRYAAKLIDTFVS